MEIATKRNYTVDEDAAIAASKQEEVTDAKRFEVEVPVFVSLTEAEEWCSELFKLRFGCSFEGFDIDTVNAILKHLVLLSRDFPEVASDLDMIGNCEIISARTEKPDHIGVSYGLCIDAEHYCEDDVPEYGITDLFLGQMRRWLSHRSEHVSIGAYSGSSGDVFGRWVADIKPTNEYGWCMRISNDWWLMAALTHNYGRFDRPASAKAVRQFLRDIFSQIRKAKMDSQSSM